MTLPIRPVRPDEHQAVADLVVDAYRAVVVHLDDYEQELRDVGHRAGAADVLVATDGDGKLLGTVTYVADGGPYAEISEPGEAEFRMLAVALDAQRAGVGRVLVEHLVAESRARGKHALVLSSGPRMTTAHRLYERLGFRRTPERDWDPIPGLTLVTYRMDL